MRQCLRSQSCKLELLNLSWNAIGPEGGHLLAEALPVCLVNKLFYVS